MMAFLRYAEARGYTCDIFFPLLRGSPRDTEERLGVFASLGKVSPVRVSELLPHFARARRFAHRCPCLAGYDAYLLISDSLMLAEPLVRQRLPFAAWVAGSFPSEVEAMGRTKLRHYYLYNRLFDGLLLRIEARAGQAADAVVAVSSYAAEHLRRSLRLPYEKVAALSGPVDTSLFRPGEAVRDRPYVLCVSRLERGKGLPTLLRAFRRIVDERPEVELQIVGEGRERRPLEGLCHRLRLVEAVRFVGELRGNQLAERYRGAAAFVMPSRRETLGNVLLEALASGVPVVSTDCGGPRDPIIPNVTGLLVPVDDPRTMAECTLRLLTDRRLAEALAHAGRQKAVSEYGFDAVYPRLDAMLRAHVRGRVRQAVGGAA